jgi:hypothetical protein
MLRMFIIRLVRLNLLLLVENLHPDECIEYKYRYLGYLSLRLVGEYYIGSKIKKEYYDKLINRFSNDYLPHCHSNERRYFLVWLSL